MGEVMQIEPIQMTQTTAFGATVSGVDLNRLGDDEWAVIEAAWYKHAVLVFPNQHIEEAAHVALGERIGELEEFVADRKSVPISNRKLDGSAVDPNSDQFQILKGNEGWHTDSTYMPLSARASILAAQVVPAQGGQTEWADMRAAYDALDDEIREQIADLAAYHSLFYSQAKVGHKPSVGASYGLGDQEIPLRPLVKVHPITQRPALFIGRHAHGIPGLSEAESEALLERLTTFACQSPRVFAHAWEPGDVAMWDNRCVLHRARPYDYAKPRVMRHVRVAGDPVTEAGIAA
ncbi:MAG: taurine catabolism dioxygenase TauD [Gammaproteobacteria bacterium]|nr:taurine catabolism dioxygenase TauD [Gammaproteobacteria bacterium]